MLLTCSDIFHSEIVLEIELHHSTIDNSIHLSLHNNQVSSRFPSTVIPYTVPMAII